MMTQFSFADAEFAAKMKVSRRERFLDEMARVVPWRELPKALEPVYYPDSAGKCGRPPVGPERMLRMAPLQQWFGLSDAGLEDSVDDS
jgi:IS5 family transposase